MEWSTRITDLLGCKYPIIQGAFHRFGTAALAAPVSEAGGFGMITASALNTPEKLREDIRRATSMTDKPFGVNLTVGLCPQIEEMREVVIEEGIRAVETAAYRAEDHGRKLKEAGVKWIHKVATMKHALAAERQGADAVVIVGLEGTGFKHSSQLPTLISITWAVKQIKIPVIAAGGIGDARGFLAALSMGAEGVYMGTAFMATDECPVPEQFKQALVKADPTDPTYRERCLAPPKSEEYERVMRMKGSVPLDRWLSELRRAQATPLEGGRSDDMEEVGRLRGGSLAVAVIDEVVSVRKRIEEIVRGAEEIVTSGNFPRVRNFLTVKE